MINLRFWYNYKRYIRSGLADFIGVFYIRLLIINHKHFVDRMP